MLDDLKTRNEYFSTSLEPGLSRPLSCRKLGANRRHRSIVDRIPKGARWRSIAAMRASSCITAAVATWRPA